MNFSKSDLERIEKAVEEVELSTSGEVVPVIIKQSAYYAGAHFRLAILLALVTPLILYFSGISLEEPLWPLLVQFPALIVGYLLAYIPIFKRWFALHEEKSEEVHQRAIQAFFENGLVSTKDRTGILIMVSLLEHKIEILADEGINQLVPKDTWEKIVPPFILKIKQGHLTDGMIESIHSCGKILTEHFPRKEDDSNELPNNLVSS